MKCAVCGCDTHSDAMAWCSDDHMRWWHARREWIVPLDGKDPTASLSAHSRLGRVLSGAAVTTTHEPETRRCHWCHHAAVRVWRVRDGAAHGLDELPVCSDCLDWLIGGAIGIRAGD